MTQAEGVRLKRKVSKATYYAEHREKLLAQQAAYRTTHRTEVKVRGAAYRATHRAEARARSASWHIKNLKWAKAYGAAYRATHREQQKAYDATHREERLAYHTAYNAEHREEQKASDAVRRATEKMACFEAYGGAQCACPCSCSETNIKCLSLDHINGGGNEERKRLGLRGGGAAFYRHLRELDYPPGYQVLCYNCNCGRAHNGGICPHEATAG